MNRKNLIINGSNFSDLDSFYIEIDNTLTKGLDWQTGHNLDAFNDLLRGGFGVFEYEEPITIVWVNSQKSIADLGHAETVKYYSRMLTTCHYTNRAKVKGMLESATKGQGESLFEILVDIIKKHKHIELQLK